MTPFTESYSFLGGNITKFEMGVPVQHYAIINGKCNCPGGQYEKVCKHLKMQQMAYTLDEINKLELKYVSEQVAKVSLPLPVLEDGPDSFATVIIEKGLASLFVGIIPVGSKRFVIYVR